VQGNVIGSHGKSHLPLFEIDPQSAAHEVSESKKLIEQRLGRACEHFASPWGHVNGAVMGLVRNCGYKTLSSTIPGPNKVPYDLFRLRRLDSSAYASSSRFNQAILTHVDAHSRLEVALLKVRENWKENRSQMESLSRFDLVVCLDERAHELCAELGLPCLRYGPERVRSHRRLHELLLKAQPEMARDREIAFTQLTFQETHPAWTYLSSFLRGTSRIR
jgi:polysaccharide deacetylase